MIHLVAKVRVSKLAGQVATVPKEVGGKLQVKRVEPTYEEQTITYDEDYDGLSYVIVGPKPRPLFVGSLTDEIANPIVSAVCFADITETSLIEETEEG